MITLSNNTKGLALLQQVEEIYGKVYTSDSLLETVLYWGINCTSAGSVHTIADHFHPLAMRSNVCLQKL